MYTRKDYMTKKCTHREYYGQFVNQEVKDYIAWVIGKDRIVSSTDKHFNNIPLARWDLLVLIKDIIDRDLLRKAQDWKDPKTYPWSLCTQVCVAKEAAQQIKEESTT